MIKEITLKLDNGKEIVLKAPFKFRAAPLSVYALIITDRDNVHHFVNHGGEYDGWGKETEEGTHGVIYAGEEGLEFTKKLKGGSSHA